MDDGDPDSSCEFSMVVGMADGSVVGTFVGGVVEGASVDATQKSMVESYTVPGPQQYSTQQIRLQI